MPIEVISLDNGMGVYWIGQGIVSGQDLLEATQETFKSEQKSKLIRYALVDFTSIDGESVQAEHIRTKAYMDTGAAAMNSDIAVALVAPQDVVFGLVRMWEAFVDETGWRTNVFRSRNEAEQWIRGAIDKALAINPAFESIRPTATASISSTNLQTRSEFRQGSQFVDNS